MSRQTISAVSHPGAQRHRREGVSDGLIGYPGGQIPDTLSALTQGSARCSRYGRAPIRLPPPSPPAREGLHPGALRLARLVTRVGSWELGVASSALGVGSYASRFPTPDSRLPTPDSRFPIPDSRFPIPDSRFPILDSRFPILDSRFPIPDSRLPTPDSRFPIPDSRLPTPDSRLPIPDSRFPIPDFTRTTPPAVSPARCRQIDRGRRRPADSESMLAAARDRAGPERCGPVRRRWSVVAPG